MISTQDITTMARAFVAAEIAWPRRITEPQRLLVRELRKSLTTILLSLNRRSVGQSRTPLIGAADASTTCAAT